MSGCRAVWACTRFPGGGRCRPLPSPGLLAAVAIVRLPGRGGHIPYEGISPGTATPVELPGILLAALATLGLGLVLGPEAPLIALGGGLGALAVRLVKKDTPDRAVAVLAASAAFAAIATIFGSPVIDALILIEAVGLGGRCCRWCCCPA